MAHLQFKLTYFDIPGRAEMARLAFAYGDVPFVDDRIDGPQFAKILPSLPLDCVSVLDVDGVTYAQSLAIARCAAKLTGVYPASPLEALRVDMLVDNLQEIVEPMGLILRQTDEKLKAELTEKFLGKTLPRSLKALEELVRGRFFNGDSASLADLYLFDIVSNYLKLAFASFDLSVYSKLLAVVPNVQALPTIATYIAKK